MSMWTTIGLVFVAGSLAATMMDAPQAGLPLAIVAVILCIIGAVQTIQGRR